MSIDRIRFERFAAADPGKIALVDAEGREFPRGEVLVRSNRLANGLREAGLARVGGVVATIAPNCPDVLVIFHAVTRLGMYFMPINWHLVSLEVEHILSCCRPETVIIHERLSAIARSLIELGVHRASRLLSIGSIAGVESLDDFLAQRPDEMCDPVMLGRGLFHSSGSTGRPNLVKHSLEGAHLAIDRQVQFQISQGIEPEDDNVHLCATTLYHQGGMQSASTAFHMGHKVVLMDRWDPQAMLARLERYCVTTTSVVPAMFGRLLRLPGQVREGYDVSSLKQVLHGAAPCPIHIKKAMIDWWGPVLQEYYCGTEGQATTVSSEEWLRYPGTVGRPYPGVDIRIVDDGGNELPVGQPGNIHIRHAQGWTFEYLGDAQATFASRTAAYFTLGDVGYCNEEGYLFICDRRVDSINVGGEKVFSIEVEHALMQHPAVADCAVLGFKDGLFGETVWAFVQPGAGFEPGLELRASILEFISGRLATWKLPRHIEFRSELPRGPNGKIYKKQLRETLPSVPTDGGS